MIQFNRVSIFLTVSMLLLTQLSLAQKQIKGVVLDKSTRTPVSYATIHVTGQAGKGTSCDREGRFQITINDTSKRLTAGAFSYNSVIHPISDKSMLQTIELEKNDLQLDEITVTASRKVKYRNKNNEAVELIRRVIDAKEKNDARNLDRYSQLAYEKLSMSLSIDEAKVEKSRLLRKFPFLKKNINRETQEGRALVPIFLQETSTQENYLNGKLNANKVIAKVEKRVDQKFDEDGFDEFMDKIYGKPDLYEHDIQLGNRRILSPIAAEGPLFYKYFIVDTIKTSSPWQIQLSVSPRNKQDVLASGMLYIDLDSNYAVRQAKLRLSEKANINWVDNVAFEMHYQNAPNGKYFLSKSMMTLDLGVFKDGMQVFGVKTFIASDFKDHLFDIQSRENRRTDKAISASTPSSSLMVRPEKLTGLEQASFDNVDSLQNNTSFNRYMNFASFLVSGYHDLGKIEVGPLNSTYSFNNIEGNRFRVGMLTTDAFSRKVVFDAYLAYGSKDRAFKYKINTTFSLTDNSIYTFPVKAINMNYTYDIETPGQQLNYLSDDNFLLSFRRGVNDKMWYKGKYSLEYLHELDNHLSFKIGLNRQTITPNGNLKFSSDIGTFKSLTTSEITGEIRWAPNEKFFQGKRYRRIINTGNPIFTLRTDIGIKGVMGSEYNYQRFVFNTTKRFYLSQLGYSDIQLETGIIFGKVPYPLLTIHRANQTYSYQLSSYNLMNSMEFIGDKYAGLNVQHMFNGFFLNKIPLIKALQWREIITFKILTSSMRNDNLPSPNAPLFNLPTNIHGETISNRLNGTPYIEAGVGLANIFKLLRVDYVRRFNHLNYPNVSRWGIRAKLYLDF
ncbi:MAG: DUF5686 and carboxypeptidase regulatory-like domain-containing protein [Sphingobacterium sp.]|jgi:hypothetical protein|nr:DUF5686 and carboxypeptidase regulatory-like domain-containing protein [Sphingobacterium sp.]